ncbi:hypothetical protein GCM10009092_07450 [Bowmanella denitrificans]|uniref:DUF6933 domain-containing protein n=1 Tax=Bowmanella denitrificans TaxID=366582 RepID=A0ABP3GH72_9ALTE
MIKLHCTQKLIAKLPMQGGALPQGGKWQNSLSKQIDNNPLSGWHANLVILHRRNCVLLVHNQTRFPLFMIGLTKLDFAALDYHFADCFINTLLKIGANNEQLNTAQTWLAPHCIEKTSDRSVQGTLNLMAGNIEHMLWYDSVNITECSPYKTAAWLSERPYNVKGQKDSIWPNRAMLQLLENG